MKQNNQNKDRLIAKMIATALLTASVAGIGGGVVACHNAVKYNPDNYNEDGRYIAGVISMAVGAPMLSLGFSVYPFKSKEENNEENNNKEDSLTK